MKTWFVPPIVIPILFLIAIVVMVAVKWGV